MENQEFNKKKDKLYEFVSSKEYRPMKKKVLAELLCVPKQDRKGFSRMLFELEKEGKIIFSETGKVMKPEGNFRTGVFSSTRKGFGFVILKGEEDIFIPDGCCKEAFDGDIVLVKLSVQKKEGTGKLRDGIVVKVIERNNNLLVGTFEKSVSFGFVIPDDRKINLDIFVPQKNTMGAVTGHKVVVKITDFGDEMHHPEGEVIEILGHKNDPGVDILSVIKSLGISETFPEEVMKQAAGIPERVSEDDLSGRMDLRKLRTVTIDGEDAKDLDDAVTLSRSEDGIYHLGVHIADAAAYVTERSALDKEALNRGTSIYLADRVIPMLPHKLSNGICSLNAGEDRLALSCLMDFNGKGEPVNHQIAETVIHVDERMSYTDVNDILTGENPELCKRYKEDAPMFVQMEELAEILRKSRKKKGSIDFDFPECKIIMGENGKVEDIVQYDRNKATYLIEEFMLAANRVVAEEFFWREVPFLYRTHEVPDLDKMKELAMLTRGFGYHLKVGSDEMHPRELQKLIESIEGTEEEAFISRLTLRSMKRAKYSVINEGHFGLAMDYYTHFTSPIRRYPDLQIHRIIKGQLRKGLSKKKREHYESILPGIAVQTSRLERRADEAEREVAKMKKAEYMEQYIDEVYEGIISGMTFWGMYIELPNTVEGMIRLTDMRNDRYKYDDANYLVTGERTGKSYRLGEKVRIVVKRVDRMASTIDFALFQPEEIES